MKSINLDRRLLSAIEQLLEQAPTGLSEYELMVQLDDRFNSLYPKPDLSAPLVLFQHHFFLRHSLYVLQDQHAKEGQWQLDISPLRIIKRPAFTPTDSTLPAKADPLKTYYLDLSNLNKESDLSVQRLLSDFWSKLSAYRHQPQALQLLGLKGDEPRVEQKKRYKQLLQQHHPDKGGDATAFREVQDAWEAIKSSAD